MIPESFYKKKIHEHDRVVSSCTEGWFCRRETSLLTHDVKQIEPWSLVISLPSNVSLVPQDPSLIKRKVFFSTFIYDLDDGLRAL